MCLFFDTASLRFEPGLFDQPSLLLRTESLRFEPSLFSKPRFLGPAMRFFKAGRFGEPSLFLRAKPFLFGPAASLFLRTQSRVFFGSKTRFLLSPTLLLLRPKTGLFLRPTPRLLGPDASLLFSPETRLLLPPGLLTRLPILHRQCLDAALALQHEQQCLLSGGQRLRLPERSQRLQELPFGRIREPRRACRHVLTAKHPPPPPRPPRSLQRRPHHPRTRDGPEVLLHRPRLELRALRQRTQPAHMSEHLLLGYDVRLQPVLLQQLLVRSPRSPPRPQRIQRLGPQHPALQERLRGILVTEPELRAHEVPLAQQQP